MSFLFYRYVAADDGIIRCAPIRQQLLSGEWADPCSSSTGREVASPLTISQLRPDAELDLTVTSFAINPAGTHAVLGGPTLTDPELSVLYVVDLTPQHTRPLDSGETLENPQTLLSDVHAFPIDNLMYSSHPGLHIVQVSWHPDSDVHVAVLTSDSTWRLYDVNRPDLPEQTVELHVGGFMRGVQEGEEDAYDGPESIEKAVAFRFGVGDGWDRFAVYFLFDQGGIYFLCPIAPFGARYPSPFVKSLKGWSEKSAEEGPGIAGVDANRSMAAAWLQRAFEPVELYISSSIIADMDLESVVPHVLDGGCPVLMGPLSVMSAGDKNGRSPMPFDAAEDMTLWRFGGVCTVLAMVSASGPAEVYLVCGGATPYWHGYPPQCIVENGKLRAVRSQAAPAHGQEYGILHRQLHQQLAMLDYIHIHAPQGQLYGPDSVARTAGSRRAALHVDLSTPDMFYCVYPQGVYAVSLDWLPTVAEYMAAMAFADVGRAAELPDALPSPSVEELYRTVPNSITASVTVGDSLCGSGVVLLLGDCTGVLVRRTPTRASLEEGSSSVKAHQEEKERFLAEVESQIERVYADVLKGVSSGAPKKAAVQESSVGVERALADAISMLRSKHVEFAHRSHHDLSQRLEQLQQEVISQKERADKVKVLTEKATERGAELQAKFTRAAWMSDNIARRVQLLAELHYALPQPPSAADVVFKHEVLPRMEDAAGRLEEEVMMVSGRVAALMRGLKPSPAAGSAVAAGTMPPAELRRVRETLLEHDRAIRAARERVKVLQEALGGVAMGA